MSCFFRYFSKRKIEKIVAKETEAKSLKPEPKKSQKQLVWDALMTGRGFTSYELNKIAHTVDARKWISDLRKEGVPISDDFVTANGRRFKVYFLNPSKEV